MQIMHTDTYADMHNIIISIVLSQPNIRQCTNILSSIVPFVLHPPQANDVKGIPTQSLGTYRHFTLPINVPINNNVFVETISSILLLTVAQLKRTIRWGCVVSLVLNCRIVELYSKFKQRPCSIRVRTLVILATQVQLKSIFIPIPHV